MEDKKKKIVLLSSLVLLLVVALGVMLGTSIRLRSAKNEEREVRHGDTDCEYKLNSTVYKPSVGHGCLSTYPTNPTGDEFCVIVGSVYYDNDDDTRCSDNGVSTGSCYKVDVYKKICSSALDAKTGVCLNPTADGTRKKIASDGTNVSVTGNYATTAGSYRVVYTANNGHYFSDGTSEKSFYCPLNAAQVVDSVEVTCAESNGSYICTAHPYAGDNSVDASLYNWTWGISGGRGNSNTSSITITPTDGANSMTVAASCTTSNGTVTGSKTVVLTNNKILPTSVTISCTSTTIAKGSFTTCTANVLPENATNKTAIFSMEAASEGIIRVESHDLISSATVYGLDAGDGTLVVELEENENGPITATKIIHVVDNVVVSGEMQVKELTLAKNDASTYGFVAVFKDKDGNVIDVDHNIIRWESANSSVVSVNGTTGNGIGVKSYNTESSGVKISACVNSDLTGYKKVCAEATVKVTCKEWTLSSNKVTDVTSGYASSKDSAQRTGVCNYIERRDPQFACETVTENGQNVMKCKYMNRCCGSSGTPSSKACYADNPNIQDATAAAWISKPSKPYNYLIANTQEKDCKPSACFVNSDKSDYKWVRIDKAPSGYTKDSTIQVEEECTKEAPRCYIDTNGGYHWGKYKNKQGYSLVPNAENETDCNSASKCYVKGDDYKWSNVPLEGYTVVEGVTNGENCRKEEEHCYLHNGEYIWGDFSTKPGYYLTKVERDYCIPNQPHCYLYKNKEYKWGDYSLDNDYTLVPDIDSEKTCGKSVPVPPTALNTEMIFYIAMGVLIVTGVGFVYYATSRKKND